MTYPQEVNKRRTFAIISHPDAGKTTITEKVLLYGNAIQTAGSVKGKGSAAHAKSCLLYTSPSPRDLSTSRMPSSA